MSSKDMSNIVIKVQNLGKKYQIRHEVGKRYQTLREAIVRKGKALVRFQAQPAVEDFWAVKDISFEIKRGECVGIIGRNGAGKSTLLKLLSRITEPTTGRIELRGRVGSLLEVGTGFHPELTGRENIYLNGNILGMTHREISRKFDEIVAFAGVEKFLDTPAKHYSSGMYVRLAFAVAAHLEPEILVVDEVLAVGDVQFQEKCIGKMKDVATKQGRTVLFVSHNMAAVRTLCSRALLLEQGRVALEGETTTIINGYNFSMRDRKIDAKTDLYDQRFRRGEGAIRFTSVEVTDEKGVPNFHFYMGDAIHFRISYETFKEMKGIKLFVGLKGGLTKEFVTTFEHSVTEHVVPPGVKQSVVLIVPNITLRPGDYPLYFGLMDQERSAKSMDVLDEATLPVVVDVKGRELRDGFDSRVPVGYVSLPSFLSNKMD